MARNVARLVAAVLVVAAFLGFAACNYTEGQCYRREDIEGSGTDGVGGGPIVPGWGGFGDAPPEPQDATDPPPLDCNKTEQPDTGEGTTNSGSGEPDTTTATPDFLAEDDAFFTNHPQEATIATWTASYAASSLAAKLAGEVPDPESVNDATIDALVEQYAPIAVDEAEQWIGSVDPTTLALPQPNISCLYPPYDCSPYEFCPFFGEAHRCVLSACDIGKCSLCPIDIPGMVIRAWCSYPCYSLGDGKPVGSVLVLTLTGGKKIGPICVPL